MEGGQEGQGGQRVGKKVSVDEGRAGGGHNLSLQGELKPRTFGS